MKGSRCLLSLLVGLILAASGCRHAPVAANYGSAYITSQPPQAEIILDGQLLTQTTPAEIGGIPGGDHQLRLRHLNYASYPVTITIRPGVINRFSFDLVPQSFRLVAAADVPAARDAVIDQAAGLIYAAGAHSISAVRIADTSLLPQQAAAMPFDPEALAVCGRSDRLICLGRLDNGTKTLAIIDRATLAVAAQDTAAAVQGLSRVALSPGGDRVIGADTAGRRLLLFDPVTASATGSLALPRAPDHIGFAPDGRFYAASVEPPALMRIDLGSGAVEGWAATGARPGGIFWDNSGRTAGVWDRTAKTLTLVNTANWATATGLGNIGGDTMFAVCWSPDPDYLLALTFKQEPFRSESGVSSVFLPEWTAYGHLTTPETVYKKLLPLDDQHRVVILETRTGRLLLLWVNI